MAKSRELAKPLERWFCEHGRAFPWRDWTDPYRVTVAEVLLQRTRAEVVAAFLPAFLEKYRSWDGIAAARVEDLELDLARIGLQRRRADSLKLLAAWATDSGRLADATAPGVGQYIERAVRVALVGEALPMVDANFVRIVRRVFAGSWMADYRYDPRLQSVAHALVEEADDPRHVNWAVLDLAATVCTPSRPHCGTCPLRPRCAYATDLHADDSRTDDVTVQALTGHHATTSKAHQ